MGSINTVRVLIGGGIAGVLLVLADYSVNGMFLRDEWEAWMTELGLPPYTTSAIVIFILLTLALGLISVWLYAAIRPRFGSGPKTAAIAGLIVWVLVALWPFLQNTLVPVWPSSVFLTAVMASLIAMPLATVIGAMFYGEKAPSDSFASSYEEGALDDSASESGDS